MQTALVRVLTPLTLLLAALSGWAADVKEDPKNTIEKYVVDITSGAVSAGGIIGLNKSAVQQIETSQDVVAAIQPFTSGDQKTGFGLAITPARTSILPMSGHDYYHSNVRRLLGGVTLSYAQNTEDIGARNYRKAAYSIDTTYYLDREADPIVIASKAYDGCNTNPTVQMAVYTQQYTDGKISRERFFELTDDPQKLQSDLYKKCVETARSSANKSAWNADRVNLSYGAGTIRPAGGDAVSLGKMVTANAQFGVGAVAALQMSLRSVRHAVDGPSLATTPTFKNSSLAAARLTLGSAADANSNAIRALVEVSNAKDSAPAAFKGVFLVAAGLDYKLFNGVWLEFRLGKNRAAEDGRKQTAGLLNVTFTPSSTLFAAK